MFESIESPRELFAYQLGAALTMEKTVLDMLDQLEMAAQREQLKEQFRHHAQETEQQIHNLEQAFQAIRRRGRRQAVPTPRASRRRTRC